MKTKDLFLALLVALIWGANFTVIKIGLQELPPLLLSALRFSVVAIPAVFFIPFPKTSLWNVLAVGIVLGVIKFSLLFIAMNVGMTAGLSSLLLQMQVLFTIGLSLVIFREPLTLSQGAGITVALLGFACFYFSIDSGISVGMNIGSSNVSLLGLSLILLAAFSWGIANIIMKRMNGVNLLHFMVWVSLVPPLPLLLLSYFLESRQPLELLLNTTISSWLALIYIGLISTLLAFILWGRLLTHYSAATVTPFALLIPVAGIATSSIVLNESMTSLQVTGAALIMLGLALCVFGSRLGMLLNTDRLSHQER